MIILTETTDNLQVVLGGAVAANQLSCMSAWRDITTTGYTPGRTLTLTNSTTDVNVVPAPGSSTQRVVDFISVFNLDTATATVTVKLDANGTEYILFRGVLLAGERLEYQEGTGFRTFDAQGTPKGVSVGGVSPISSSLQSVVLGADQTNNNAVANTIADVSGLSFAVTAAHVYWFRFVIWYTAAATTTGSRWAISGPGSPTLIGYRSSTGLSAAATAGTDVMTDVNAAAYDSPATSNATSPTQTAGQANTAIIEGFINPSSNGTVIARFASEITNSAIVAKAGSVVFYQMLT